MKRFLWQLKKLNRVVIIYRTDNNLGRIGVLFSDNFFRQEYNFKIKLPNYIRKEAINLIK